MSSVPEAIEGRQRRGRAIGGQLLGWGISITCIAFVATKVDFSALGTALLHFEPHWMAFGLISLAAGYAIRIARWAVMLRAAGAHVRTSACVAPFLGSIALNNVLPLRAGDVIRALVFPARIGVERTTAIASLLLERVMDLVSLMLCLGAGLALLGPGIQLAPALRTIVPRLAIGAAVALAAIVFASPHLPRLCAWIESRTAPRLETVQRLARTAAKLFARIGAMSRPRVLALVGLMSVVVWIFEAGLYFSLMKGLHIQSGFAGALAVAATTTLSTLVPSTPGYVGPFHLAAFAAVTMLGSDASQAGAFAFLVHLTLWGATTLAGAVAILLRRDLFARRRTVEP